MPIRFATFVSLLTLLGQIAGITLATPPAKSAALHVSLAADRLSVAAHRVPLRQILEQLARRGIDVRLEAGIDPPVTAAFTDLPVDRGLATVLRCCNHALVWQTVPGPLGDMTRLAAIHVFEPGHSERAAPLVVRPTLEVETAPDGRTRWVRGQVLLRLRPGITGEQFRNLLAERGATLLGGHAATGIYRIGLPADSDVAAVSDLLQQDPRVAAAQPNFAYPHVPAVPLFAEPLGGLAELSAARPAVRAGTVAILDTGVSDLPGLTPLITAGLDALDPAAALSDAVGHGTQMALIAGGLVTPLGAPDAAGPAAAALIAVRAFDDNGYTSDDVLLDSLTFALGRGAQVISLSWGGETPSPFMQSALSAVAASGVVVVAAAGNAPTGEPVYPAAYPSVAGVAALDPDGTPWPQSNYGPSVTLAAPGKALLPVGSGGGQAGLYAGTSIATAYTAAALARYLSAHPDATPEQALQAVASP